MNKFSLLAAAPILLGLVMIGCQRSPPQGHGHGEHAHDDATIHESLAKLSADDRKLAEEQGYCALELESKLGSMGVPLKVMVKDRPVFVCCSDCSKQVLKNPDQTLATVELLRAKTAKEKHHP